MQLPTVQTRFLDLPGSFSLRNGAVLDKVRVAYEQYGALTPEMVTVGSHRKVWWQCPEGHVWKAVIYSRARGQRCGCPVCAGRVKARRTG